MDLQGRARSFAALHVNGEPLVLWNAWDAGSACAVRDAGAAAIATSSWAIACAHGYPDGEALPLDLLELVVERIAVTVDLPLSVDFEGGYSEDEAELAANVGRLLRHGVVGINFEDRRVRGEGLHPIARQCERIGALREAADAQGIDLFINARTDLFLDGSPSDVHGDRVAEAEKRASAYAEAGASGFFVPGLADAGLIGRICQASPLPVNVMLGDDDGAIQDLAALGVARISFGPIPFLMAMKSVEERARRSVRAKTDRPRPTAQPAGSATTV